jgi:hypothetical protein
MAGGTPAFIIPVNVQAGSKSMGLLLEITKDTAKVNGVECRVWNAISETGKHCFLFVHLVAVSNEEDKSEFSKRFEIPEDEIPVVKEGEDHG